MISLYNDKIARFINNFGVLAIFLGIAYLNGILNFEHPLPSNRNLNVGLQCAMVVSFGILLDSFIRYKLLSKNNELLQADESNQVGTTTKKLLTMSFGWSTIGWLFLFFLLLIQPYINYIIYPDGLITPLATVLLAMVMSVLIKSIPDKTTFIITLAVFYLIGAVLEVATLYAHLFQLRSLYDVLIFSIAPNYRPVGNIAQPNQVAFISAIGITTLLFLYSVISPSDISKKTRTFLISIGCISVVFLLSGIAITGSRAGIIMALFSFIAYFLFVDMNKKEVMKLFTIVVILVLVGYFLGNYLMDVLSQQDTAIEKITKGRQPLRTYQLQQALVAFQDSPLTGFGYQNYDYAGLVHAQQLPWFTFNNHSHFIISQIASELGLLGLMVFIPLAAILLKNLKFTLSPLTAYAYVMVLLSLLYSCSEYPLWYFIFLINFSVLLAVIDNTNVFSLDKLPQAVYIIVFLFFGSSIYYYQQYQQYSDVYYKIYYQKPIDVQQKAFMNLKPVYGYMRFYEQLAFVMIPDETEYLKIRAEMGSRLVQYQPTYGNLTNQATLLLRQNRFDESLVLLKAACVHNFAVRCDTVENSLKGASTQSKDMANLYQQFLSWRQSNALKTKLDQ